MNYPFFTNCTCNTKLLKYLLPLHLNMLWKFLQASWFTDSIRDSNLNSRFEIRFEQNFAIHSSVLNYQINLMKRCGKNYQTLSWQKFFLKLDVTSVMSYTGHSFWWLWFNQVLIKWFFKLILYSLWTERCQILKLPQEISRH